MGKTETAISPRENRPKEQNGYSNACPENIDWNETNQERIRAKLTALESHKPIGTTARAEIAKRKTETAVSRRENRPKEQSGYPNTCFGKPRHERNGPERIRGKLGATDAATCRKSLKIAATPLVKLERCASYRLLHQLRRPR